MGRDGLDWNPAGILDDRVECRASGGEVDLTPKETVILAVALSSFMFLAMFDYLGWLGLLFPLVLMPIGLYEARRRSEKDVA